MKRRDKFTPPRTITIDTKYEGAVTIDVWPGYAVQVVSKTGERKVIVGPEVYLLEYDETLEKMSFSSGTPKTDKALKNDAYLRVLHNTISDLVRVETRDLCPIDVLVSYRVNFEGEPEKWFNVENYVKFLTDHLRSVLRNKVKQLGIEEFYNNSIDIIRDTILGIHPEAAADADGEIKVVDRTGKTFKENGMRVYDLEVLNVTIQDSNISHLLEDSQHEAVQQRLLVEQKQRQLETTEQTEKITQKIEIAKSETARKKFELKVKDSDLELKADLADLNIETEVEKQRTIDQSNLKDLENEIETKALEIQRSIEDQQLSFANERLEQKIKELNAEAGATKVKAEAISPQLMAVLESFSNKDLAGKLAENFNVLSILGGGNKSVVEIAQDLLGGTPIGELLKKTQFHIHPGGGSRGKRETEDE
jgi:major vault protein